MTSFNDGIEAAKVAVRQSLEGAAMAAEQAHGEDVAAGLEEVSVRLLSKLDALKRPEPSEAEKVERVARAISETRRCPKENGQEVGGAWWWDTRHDGPENSFAHESREEDRRAARAALAAMGGEA